MAKKLNKQSIGVGVAGTGFIGPVHVEGLRRNGFQVLGLVASSPEKARVKAAELGIPRAYDSFEAMLADDDIDCVHITTPNTLHFPQAKAALLAGKHVVCEKPLAMNTEQTAELVQLAKETGLVNAVNFNLRMYPMVQQARSIVRSGQLGDLFIFQGSYLQDWLLLPTDWNWRIDKEAGGSLRTVGDIGSHWLDLVTFITGLRVREVLADFHIFLPVRKKPAGSVETFTGKLAQPTDTVDHVVDTEDYATILLHYENGARGVVTVAQMCAGRKNRTYLEINGSKSSIAWNGERPNELWIGHRSEPNQVLIKDPALLSPEARETAAYPGGHAEGFPDTFKQLYKKVYDYILAGDYTCEPDFPTFEDGHYEMQLGEAIERSAREKTWVRVSS